MILNPKFARLPRHLGLIPDGNRRWADARGMPRQAGYEAGVEPGLRLVEVCRSLGIEEVSIYGFTKENVRRPSVQVDAFRRACVEFAERIASLGAALHVVGDMRSKVFPPELKRFAVRRAGDVRINLLANYGWKWDLQAAQKPRAGGRARTRDTDLGLASGDVPRVDLIVRWGGRQRLSGFLPIQSAYADIYTIDTLWPDMEAEEFYGALRWYERQDVTIGG